MKCSLTIDINEMFVDDWYQWNVCWQLISMKCLLTIDINQISVDNVDLILINSTPIFVLHGALNFIIWWCPQSSRIQWVIIWYKYMNPVKMSICFLIHWSPKKENCINFRLYFLFSFIECKPKTFNSLCYSLNLKTFKSSGFQIFWFSAYLMKAIPKTCYTQ